MREFIASEDWVGKSRVGGNSKAPSRIFRLAHDHMPSHIALDIEIGAADIRNCSLREAGEVFGW